MYLSDARDVSAPASAGFADVAPCPAGLAGFGQPAPPRVSPGEYGLALSRIIIPPDPINLLRQSGAFGFMTNVLDNSYLDHQHWIALQKSNPALRLNSAFRVAGGTNDQNGRRILYVSTDPWGSLFIPGQSQAIPTEWDAIKFHFALGANDTIPWIEAIAHETSHAYARVTAPATGPRTPVQRVQDAVVDECEARRREQRVIAEIAASKAGKAVLAGYKFRPRRTCDCERDWFPVEQKRTYLEEFVLGADWESAAKGISSVDVAKILADVAAIPLKFSTKPKPPTMPVEILRGTKTVASFAAKFPVLKSAAGQAAFVLRLVDASWRQLIAKVGKNSTTWTGGAHQLRLERHARIFFKIPVTYTICPHHEDLHVSSR